MLKRLKSFLLKSLLLVIIIGGILFFYTKNSWKNLADEESLNQLITEIENSDKLPEKFYMYFEKEFNNNLNHSTITNTFFQFFDDDISSNPSLILSKSYPAIKQVTAMDKRRFMASYYGLAMKLDAKVNQRQCLNWSFANYYFSNSSAPFGVEKACEYYFKKDINSISDEEIAKLILLFKNVSLYNPKRNPEGVAKKIKYIVNNSYETDNKKHK